MNHHDKQPQLFGTELHSTSSGTRNMDLLFKAITELRSRESGVKVLQAFCSYLDSPYFYMFPRMLEAFRYFQNSEKVGSGNFCHLIYCVYGGLNFWRSVLCHFPLTPFLSSDITIFSLYICPLPVVCALLLAAELNNFIVLVLVTP